MEAFRRFILEALECIGRGSAGLAIQFFLSYRGKKLYLLASLCECGNLQSYNSFPNGAG